MHDTENSRTIAYSDLEDLCRKEVESALYNQASLVTPRERGTLHVPSRILHDLPWLHRSQDVDVFDDGLILLRLELSGLLVYLHVPKANIPDSGYARKVRSRYEMKLIVDAHRMRAEEFELRLKRAQEVSATSLLTVRRCLMTRPSSLVLTNHRPELKTQLSLSLNGDPTT
ncbi:hypothetical protein BD310DRAFT_908365 [Dichomitus squalens]|uniref:Uncharacterized protein n=1 Tax=Dichomitus squalens TaxID=114155 RepID=A0A4Q9PMG8_9APHY|nr:hypothetical protein BD310DRAFT_908365 [Dichomitus squalens]